MCVSRMTEPLTGSYGIFRAYPRSGVGVDKSGHAIAYWNVKGPREAVCVDGLLFTVHLRIGKRLERVEYQASQVGVPSDGDWSVFARPSGGASRLLIRQVAYVRTLEDLLDRLHRDSLCEHLLKRQTRLSGASSGSRVFEEYNLW